MSAAQSCPRSVGLSTVQRVAVLHSQVNSQKFRDWNERESKKQAEGMDNIGNAVMPGDSREVNEARAKVVKIKIIVYMYMRDKRSCLH